MESIKFAEVLLAAAQVREESFRMTDRRYSLSYAQAAQIACNNAAVERTWCVPIEYLLTGAWNESLDWANTLFHSKSLTKT